MYRIAYVLEVYDRIKYVLIIMISLCSTMHLLQGLNCIHVSSIHIHTYIHTCHCTVIDDAATLSTDTPAMAAV